MKDLPPAPRLKNVLGPSFILLGLALGSGELILWPYLAANYGLGLIWGAALGITFQFLLNLEIMRYSLVWGESIFVGFRRLSRFWPLWFIVSTFIPWSLPGFSSATSQIFSYFFNWGPRQETFLSIALLILTGLILTIGKTLYRTMEWIQRTIILLGLPLILLLVILLTNSRDWLELAAGLIGRGYSINSQGLKEWWWLFPAGVSWASFLGAFAYSGAGGNLNLAQSYYVKEKGLGMGRYSSKISSLFQRKKEKVLLEGETFPLTKENKEKFQHWWRLIKTEHALVFWLLGFLTIVLLAVLARSLLWGQADAQGLNFIFQEKTVIAKNLGASGGILFLLIAALMLYSTQLGVLESSARIIAENILLLSWRPGIKVQASRAFYFALWGQIVLGIIILAAGLQEPRFLLTLAAILNAVAMTILFPLVAWLNRQRLAPELQPSPGGQIFFFLAFLFFLIFSGLTFSKYFF